MITESTGHSPPRVNGTKKTHRTTNNGAVPPPAAAKVDIWAAAGNAQVMEQPGDEWLNTSEINLPQSHLRPSSCQAFVQMGSRRSRSGIWATLFVVMLAAAATVALLMWMGTSDQNQAEARAAVEGAAHRVEIAVADSVAILESLEAEGSFTPELVASISALGNASRGLVESVSALPSDNSSLVALRMQATGLAGRVSRLGETFGAAFSYRGQVEPLLSLPDLRDPLSVSSLTDNATLLTDWQFRLEQAVSNGPNQPRLLKNHEALGAMLPYIAVHRQAYVDAVGNGQPDQAAAGLSQIASLMAALRQDFDRAYSEITEIARAEIQSLSVDLGLLAQGTAST